MSIGPLSPSVLGELKQWLAPFFRPQSTASLFQFIQTTNPPSPPAKGCYVYLRDNGGGKGQLIALFPTGAAQVIATEP